VTSSIPNLFRNKHALQNSVVAYEWSYNFRITVQGSVQIRYDAILTISKRRMLNQLQSSAELPNRSKFALKSGIDNNRPRI
jgi:hypothetical protein